MLCIAISLARNVTCRDRHLLAPSEVLSLSVTFYRLNGIVVMTALTPIVVPINLRPHGGRNGTQGSGPCAEPGPQLDSCKHTSDIESEHP
jgi:hypothetical protein